MKICFIANAASPHTWKWANSFMDQGDEIHIISHEPYELKGITVHHIPYSLKNFFKYKKIVHNKIGEVNPDIIHAHQFNDCGLYGVTYKKLPCVVSAWGSDILLVPKNSRVIRAIVKYIIKKASVITSDSDDVTKKIIAYGGNDNKIYTFPMGIQENLLGNVCNISDNESLRILSTRRLEKLYNVDIIIEGFALALKENNNLTLTIGATGTVEDKLKNLSKELGVDSKVNFLGLYDEDLLGKMLRENEVFISIPSSDATSVSLLEAMGCGLYPVVSDLPANHEWIKNDDNGIILTAIDKEKVKEAILKCCKEKEQINKAKLNNINLIKEKALWKNNIKIVEKIYEDVLNIK